jgi:hypothetical protein
VKPALALAVIASWAVACGDNRAVPPDAPIEAPADAPPDADPLAALATTGLCVDAACTQISPDVREYEPRFGLYADGATKRRWLYLPPGTKIDTTDMDHWTFPVGTRIWKEFAVAGKKIETRLIIKQRTDDAPAPWFYITYAWNAAQDATTPETMGVMNANGTPHDIPSRQDCKDCHERLRPGRVLGIGALQLDYAAPASLVDLDDLVAGGLVTTPPPGAASPHFPLPGAAVDHAALGYLHANCGHCHNPTSDVHDSTPIDLRLRAGMLATVQGTPTYTTTVGVDATIPYTEGPITYDKVIIADDPTHSALIGRMNSQMGIRFMPNLGVEVVDPAGQTALVTWINSL